MKKLSLLICIVFVLISIASAGVIYDVDFAEGPTHIITLNERDVVRFNFSVREYENRTFSTLEEKRKSEYNLEDIEQKLMIREVNKKNGWVSLTLFIYGAETPQYFTLAKGNMIKVDFERDNIDDLIIGLDKIEGKGVGLILQKISIESKDKISSKEKGFFEKIKVNLSTIYYVVGGLIILILILKQKRIREYFSGEE